MSRRKLSILVVDDNINFVRRMLSILNEVEALCAIYTAHNYDQAFRMLDGKPDLVLLDIQLPGRNGISLLKRIKESAKDTEVIMLSNNVGEYYREQCKKLGALDFLDKTNDFELVPDIIKELAIKYNRKQGSCQEAAVSLN